MKIHEMKTEDLMEVFRENYRPADKVVRATCTLVHRNDTSNSDLCEIIENVGMKDKELHRFAHAAWNTLIQRKPSKAILKRIIEDSNCVIDVSIRKATLHMMSKRKH